jgi:ankyrin repeat protein
MRYHPDKAPSTERVLATQLFQAISAAYEDLLKSLQGDISDPEPGLKVRVKTPVAAAAELGDIEELRRLLSESPESANEKDELGVYPIMFAAAGGCIPAVEVLLEFGADIHAKNLIGWSVLLYASLADHAPMVRWLVEKGAWVGEQELMLAAFTGNSDALVALLDMYVGSVPKVRSEEYNCSGKTLLHMAVEGLCFLKRSAEKHAACIDTLLKRQVPTDIVEPKKSRTCLHALLADKRWRTLQLENSAVHLAVVEQLCQHGANVTLEDSEGSSAMSIAAEQGLHKVREILFMYA